MDKIADKDYTELLANAEAMDRGASQINTILITAVRQAEAICREINSRRDGNIKILKRVIQSAKQVHTDRTRRGTGSQKDLVDYWNWIIELETIAKCLEAEEPELSVRGFKETTERIRELARLVQEEIFQTPGGAA